MPPVFDFLFETKRNRLITAAIISIIFFHLFYGLATLIPTNISWLMTVKHDWGTHYLGFHFFKNEPWHFPIGRIDNYVAPIGANIGFTDSIPLMAILFKLFAFILPEDFQYFGLWLLICHFLVAYYTILLLRLFHVKSIFILLAVILITTNPVLVYRGLHPSLCAHWLILASLYLYFIPTTVQTSARTLKYQLILLGLSAWINPYICFMVLGLTVALTVKLCWINKLQSKQSFFLYTLFSVIILLGLWYILGLIGFNEKENLSVNGGYGLYGMNLNSLYNSDGYSAFLPQLKQVSNKQYEGYMYLGLGMIILLFLIIFVELFAFFKKKNSGLEKKTFSFRSNAPLAIILILFALFAITHVVTFNNHILFTIPLPDFLIKFGGIFRASGRFFWPLYYLLFLFLLIRWSTNSFQHSIKISLLLLVVAVQLYDIKLFFSYRKLTYGTYAPPIDVKKWTELMSRFDRIILYPPFEATYKESMDYQYFCYLAAKLNKPITTGYVARENNIGTQKFKDSLAADCADGNLSEQSFYITTPEYIKGFYDAKIGMMDGYCFLFAGNIKEITLLNLADDYSSRNKKTVDSLTAVMNSKIAFKQDVITIPATTGLLHYQMEGISQKKNTVSMNGWAFREGKDNNKGDSIFFVLTSAFATYTASAPIYPRSDVTGYFKKTYLDDAGFNSVVYKTNLLKGVYNLGLLLKETNGNMIYNPTDQVIRIGIPEYGVMDRLSKLPPSAEIKASLEKAEVTDSLISFSGWAFLENQDASSSEISFVLIKDNANYVSAVSPVLRTDIAAYFKSGFNLNNSGFALKYKKATVPVGKYKTAVIVKDIKTGKEQSYFFSNEIEVK